MSSSVKLTLILSILSASLYSQTNQPARQYLNAMYMPVRDSTSAKFYRTTDKDAEGWFLKDYYLTGELVMVARCLKVKPDVVKDGPVVTYYKSGPKQTEGNYSLDSPRGLFREYYENGQLAAEIFYVENKNYHWQHWDDQGRPLLDKGTGTFVSRKGNYTEYKEIVDSVAVNAYNIEDGKSDTIYTILEKIPEYPGSYTELMADIRNNMTYPRSARKLGIEGTVYVRLIVDREGNVTNPYILSGISPDCDEVALGAVRKLKRWTPGRVRNKTVDVWFVLPIKFRLK